jgi:hypothetical protein
MFGMALYFSRWEIISAFGSLKTVLLLVLFNEAFSYSS